MWQWMVRPKVFFFVCFWKVRMKCNFSQKAQSGMDWHIPVQFSWNFDSGPRIILGQLRPVITHHAVYFCCCSCCCLRLSSRICLWVGSSTPASSRSSSVMSLSKQDDVRETSSHLHFIHITASADLDIWPRARTAICLYVPEEFQVVPTIVQKTLLISLQSQSLQPLPHWRLSNRQRWAAAAPECLDERNETQGQPQTKMTQLHYSSTHEGDATAADCGKILQLTLQTVKALCKSSWVRSKLNRASVFIRWHYTKLERPETNYHDKPDEAWAERAADVTLTTHLLRQVLCDALCDGVSGWEGAAGVQT